MTAILTTGTEQKYDLLDGKGKRRQGERRDGGEGGVTLYAPWRETLLTLTMVTERLLLMLGLKTREGEMGKRWGTGRRGGDGMTS